MSGSENNRYIVQVFVGALSQHYEALSVEASKQTTSEEIVSCIVERLSLSDGSGGGYELAEVIGDSVGQECKERRLGSSESPVALMLLWPKTLHSQQEFYRFYLREKLNDCLWTDSFTMDPQLIRDYFYRFLYQPKDREYPDLCQLPDLNEHTLLENLRARFTAGHIYTYVGSILIAVNPFKFHPIYNPKYVKLYQNRRLGPELPPHIFAVADAAYHCMLKGRRNQCVVISGESGSGKTESTNFLLHHLTALSQKGSHGSGVEQTILSAGPVLEAFGNAKTAHNNNSSRFGKFIQVNYKENGMVHGAVVQKYLLEKSRICSQGRNERNYHVFYYLLAGASDAEKLLLHLRSIEEYHYLSKSGCYTLDNVDEKYEFSRLKQSMEMVGFSTEKQRRLFAVLSAVLLLGNVEFQPRKSQAYHHDEAVAVRNPDAVGLISQLLRVKQETLLAALTAKKAKASGETLVINYRLPEAVAARDAMAKCLYGALFDWIVLQVNHALLSKKDTLRDHQGNSIGVLDIFGFEDFGLCNSFEQFCINYANEHLQYYFNQHVFKYEQEEYRKEGIRWTDIAFMDNTQCLQLIEGKPSGLLCLLDDQCNFPGATNETLLQKFNSVHKDNNFYEIPQRREAAFIVRHYAGKVKYQAAEMREKNLDLMRQDIVGVLKNSSMAFVRELVGADPVAVFRWAIVRAFFRGYFAFHEAGRRQRSGRDGSKPGMAQNRYRNHTPNENIISVSSLNSPLGTPPNSSQKQRKYVECRGTSDSSVNRSSNEEDTTKSSTEPKSRLQRNARQEFVVFDSSARRDSSKNQPGALKRVLCPNEAKVMERANQIVMKNKSFRPRERSKKGLKNLQTVKTLAGRHQQLGGSGGSAKARKQPLTVTAQFQQSLQSLMDTLNQANPFFIRCIKSNSNKIPNKFDEETVQRQLRYTGMLETVRIRQAGYNVRLTYDEFIQLYRILLPRGLLSSQADVRDFLLTLNLNRDNYQLGATKIFLRESEKVKLDYRLHQQIMASIVTIQRWARSVLERRRFRRLREAVLSVQAWWRSVAARRLATQARLREAAAVSVQAAWRGHRERRWYCALTRGLPAFQAHARGFLARLAYRQARLRHRRAQHNLDSHSGQSTDEAFLSKESSQEELDEKCVEDLKGQDSEGSSGIQEDSETEPVVRQGTQVSRASQLPAVTVSELSQYRDVWKPKKDVDTTSRSKAIVKRTKGSKTEVSEISSQEKPVADTYQRKGSSESLSSQKSTESQRVSDLPSGGAPVRETLHRAKKQIQALIGVSKKSDKWDRTDALSDSEVNDPDGDGTSRSAPPCVPETSLVWQRQADTLSPRVGFGDSIRSTEQSLSLDASSITASLPLRRKVAVAEKTRHPLKSSVSQDESSSDWVTVPVRTARRQKVCRSVGDSEASPLPSLADGPGGDGATLLLGTIREGPVTLEGAAADGRLVWATRKGPRAGPLDLRRRNSDPAAPKLLDQSPGEKAADLHLLEWKGSTMFTIAGHRFRKLNRFAKEDRCSYCDRPMDAVVTQGHKCSDCKQLFHTKCIQNGGVKEMPCINLGHKPGRRKMRKNSRTQQDMAKPAVTGKFSLTGTSEFTDRTDQIISDSLELQLMQDFITQKIYVIEKEEGEGHKPSEVDYIFKQALREFKDNLVATYSILSKQGASFNIKYKDLIANFIYAMQTVCTREKTREDFPVTMGVNAFRGFMNEFMTRTRTEEKEKMSKSKRKKEKKRKAEEAILYAGHTFVLTIINIPTACEICTSFFMWPIERGLVCQNCKLTCHKKCYSRSAGCGKDGGPSVGRRVFGVPLHKLAVGDGNVPVVVLRLITTIEMQGLYTEGLYRKSGVSSKVKELKALMEEGSSERVNFEGYHVHVLAAVLKSFLREMPEPLLTFDCYDDFLRAADLTDPQDRVFTLFTILKKLPKPNFDLMERLIFHLARVALHEEANRMSPSALAIVFAPCILRTNKVVPAQDSLHDISRQTQCIETIIVEQLKKLRAALADIATLDAARHTASHRLSSIRSSKIFSPEELQLAGGPGAGEREGKPCDALLNPELEEALLIDHIEEMQKEKDILTSTLPRLTRATSDDDMLSTDMDDGSLDDVAGHIEEVEHDVLLMQPARRQRCPAQRSVVSRSMSGGETAALHRARDLKRQSSSDVLSSRLPPSSALECDTDEDPIMV
ncbi:unconventional myosin-IXAa-like isoform X2 [Bacillus rossius redtenbacheri]|uniref:unconventional myosin-IXAa-like isoform X2 n=1 Tax=Bacillus rossius redtenbacheri TaxID=93214 RepID=UPI002FDDBA62